MPIFTTKLITDDSPLPSEHLISSVFLIAIKGTKILAIENDRGWEIPGGHIEGNETPKESLIREVKEEAGATFANEKPFAFVESDDQGAYKDKVMVLYVTNDFELGTFTPSEDAFGREVIEIEEFLNRYTGSMNFREVFSHLLP